MLMNLRTRTEFTLKEIAQITVGGAQPSKSPLYPKVLAGILEDALRRRLPLLHERQMGIYNASTVTRASALAWLRAQGAILPPELCEPATLDEALVRIAELGAKLAELELASAPRC